MKKELLSDLIFEKLAQQKQFLKSKFSNSQHAIGYFFIDDLLPAEIATAIYEAFPTPDKMVLKKSIREDKYVAAQMNLYEPLLEEIIYAFQDKRIVSLIGNICNIEDAMPDAHLYAGGISMMGNKQHLNPHLDNSHDKDRHRWRVLNILYYVTPDWKEEYGGNLELWPNGIRQNQVTIHSKFNRLAVMATHNRSLHSVSKVNSDNYRCCISNYYFSKKPLVASDTFHVTSFRGRPGNKLEDMILQIDMLMRTAMRKIFRNGIKENPHVYKKAEK